jgi:DNA (cytosine-5)-methyltransferase 1
VLELWSLYVTILETFGYHATCGTLTAEQYGVPQTRKRAFLIASLDRHVELPAPTHQRYKKGEPATHRDGLLPWVSMAEALGWGNPVPIVNTRGNRKTSGGNEFSADKPSSALTSSSRSSVLRSGQSVAGVGRAERAVSEPAFTVTSRTDLWQLRNGKRANATVRHEDEPAPTLTAGHDSLNRVWIPTHLNPRQKTARPRPVEEPAPTLTSAMAVGVQVWDQDAGDVRDGRAASPDARRITTEEATVLMGFHPDYPWRGSRSKQFQQIGNAVCPPVARAVLAEVL